MTRGNGSRDDSRVETQCGGRPAEWDPSSWGLVMGQRTLNENRKGTGGVSSREKRQVVLNETAGYKQ